MSWTLIPLFAVTALLYAAVGFGGGSTYAALLVLSGTDYRLLPSLALACNIVVVTGGVWRFSKVGALEARRLVPYLVTSVPAAWLGGRMVISETVFIGLLGSVLLLSGLRLLTLHTDRAQPVTQAPHLPHWPLGLCIGAGIGFLAGLVGIGGGIFLAPLLYLTGWGSARQIAAACSLFILVNSLSGLAGQLTKLGDLALLHSALTYWPLLLAVCIAGQFGSWLGSRRLEAIWMRYLTALLVLYVAIRLLWRLSAHLTV